MPLENLKKKIASCEDGGSLLVLFPGFMLIIFVRFSSGITPPFQSSSVSRVSR